MELIAYFKLISHSTKSFKCDNFHELDARKIYLNINIPECFKARIRVHAPKIYISQNHSSLKLFTNSDKGNIRENYINYYHKVHLYAFCGKMFVNFTKSISMSQNISQMASTLEKQNWTKS